MFAKHCSATVADIKWILSAKICFVFKLRVFITAMEFPMDSEIRIFQFHENAIAGIGIR